MNGWSLLFATPLFAYRPPSFALASFYTPILLVPFAALLGRRYGVSGVVSVALGAVPLIVFANGFWGSIGGSPALYLIALAVAAVAATPRPLAECLHWPGDARAARWLGFVAPFLLTLYISAGRGALANRDLAVSFVFGFSFLSYFLLFVLGMRGVRASAPLLGFVVAAVLGWLLALNGWRMHPAAPVYVSFGPLHPAHALAALAVVSAGAATAAVLGGRPVAAFWRRPYVAVTALVFLWLGPWSIARIPTGLAAVGDIHLLQVAVALPLAAFMAGVLRGARGTVFVTALVTIAMIAWAVIARLFSLRAAYIAFEAPFVAATYALMGATVAAARITAVDFSVLRRAVIAVMLFLAALGVTLGIVDGGGAVRLALAALFVAGVVAIFIAALRLRRALVARGLDTTSEKWAPFIAILTVLGTAVANLRAVVESSKQAALLLLLPFAGFSTWARQALRDYFGNRIEGDELGYLLLIAALYVVSLIIVIRGLVRTGPKVVRDTRRIAAFVREWRRGTGAKVL